MAALGDFNPRSPHGERPIKGLDPRKRIDDFNPRSPHGERLTVSAASQADSLISIHAPRTGSDCRRRQNRQHNNHFNPRSPHGERRIQHNLLLIHAAISIHAPRTGSDLSHAFFTCFAILFQSTLPARGATTCADVKRCNHQDFNPRSPHGERLRSLMGLPLSAAISIHAPRTGSDRSKRTRERKTKDFNPRSPHGERHRKVDV